MKRRLTPGAVLAALVLCPLPAYADAPPADLMAKLADYAARFERQRTHASYAVSGRLDLLDGDGHADSSKELWGHIEADGSAPRLTVIRYLEDGADKTEDAIKEARESAEKRRKERDKGKELKMPILADQQARYAWDEVEVDPKDSTRVRISFAPKIPAEDTVAGSAWVDTVTGAPISAGFKLSKTPIFVDYVHFSVEFGEKTPLGPAVSRVEVDGKGGILFLRKHFHGVASLSGYTLTL